MSLNLASTEWSPLQLPVLEIVRMILPQLSQYWNTFQSIERFSAEWLEDYPIIEWNTSKSKTSWITVNEEVLRIISPKIERWFSDLYTLWWPVQTVIAYLDFMEQSFVQFFQWIVSQKFEKKIGHGYSIRLKDEDRTFYGYPRTLEAKIDFNIWDKQYSSVEYFLSLLHFDGLSDNDNESLKQKLKSQADSHKDIILKIEGALKVKVLLGFAIKRGKLVNMQNIRRQ